jgi:hypothetical protein
MYRCTKEYSVPMMDDSGSLDEENMMIIEVGTEWEIDEDTSHIGGEVHLDSEDGQWIEIERSTLNMYFEKAYECPYDRTY